MQGRHRTVMLRVEPEDMLIRDGDTVLGTNKVGVYVRGSSPTTSSSTFSTAWRCRWAVDPLHRLRGDWSGPELDDVVELTARRAVRLLGVGQPAGVEERMVGVDGDQGKNHRIGDV